MKTDLTPLLLVCGLVLAGAASAFSTIEVILFVLSATSLFAICGAIYWNFKSKAALDQKKRIATIKELPKGLLVPSPDSCLLGEDLELKTPIYLPDSIRSRHVHIIGSTGSGKTESVVLSLLKQDVERGLGSIVLDAKGDHSFLSALRTFVPEKRLHVFDLGDKDSPGFNPLAAGTPEEASQRLFGALTWSEEFYRSKARGRLKELFALHDNNYRRNPTLVELSQYLHTSASLAASLGIERSQKEQEFSDLSGLRDQISCLATGSLASLLSSNTEIRFDESSRGKVFYFRLQSLVEPETVQMVGRLLVGSLSHLSGMAHRTGAEEGQKRPFVPVYLDEFASFACPAFTDLISKARSAGFALHFSHQSLGDLDNVSPAFRNQIADNSSTKIVMRTPDPDSAEYFSRTFGTHLYQKVTHRVRQASEDKLSEMVGEGSQREAHQFRVSPDLIKSMATGMGAVLIAHGEDTPNGAAHVFKIKFPRFDPTQSSNSSAPQN